MNYFLIMNMFQPITDAIEKALNFRCQESPSDSCQFIQRLILTEFQKDVDMLSVFKAMEELNYVGMVQCFV